VAIRGIDDAKLARRAGTYASRLSRWAGGPARVTVQQVRRMGADPIVEVTMALRMCGTPVWVMTEDCDPTRALDEAFRRISFDARR
jgi:hypothetical protein